MDKSTLALKFAARQAEHFGLLCVAGVQAIGFKQDYGVCSTRCLGLGFKALGGRRGTPLRR